MSDGLHDGLYNQTVAEKGKKIAQK